MFINIFITLLHYVHCPRLGVQLFYFEYVFSLNGTMLSV